MTANIIAVFLIIVVFLAILFTMVRNALKKEQEIYTNGIETTSVVCRTEPYNRSDHKRGHHCYVRYRGNDGKEHEGRLNLNSDLPLGRKVQIKYLPGKYENVVFIS